MWFTSSPTTRAESISSPNLIRTCAKEDDLVVHYHLGKENVIADALSHKVHCNYLLVVPLIGEESSI
jgi:hypothetical protein